jgi:uncharacterized protein (DUF488 family)
MTTLFTIGSNSKTAAQFFGLLQDANITTLIDIRAKPDSQLAGFARKTNLPYFLQCLAGIAYQHEPDLAPDPALLKAYQAKKITWDTYATAYRSSLQDRNVINLFKEIDFDKSCFLCACATPETCHRRILAEYLQEILSNGSCITHL